MHCYMETKQGCVSIGETTEQLNSEMRASTIRIKPFQGVTLSQRRMDLES